MSARRTGTDFDRLNPRRQREGSVDDRVEFDLHEHARRRESRNEQRRIRWSSVGKELAMYLNRAPPIASRSEKETGTKNVLALAAELLNCI